MELKHLQQKVVDRDNEVFHSLEEDVSYLILALNEEAGEVAGNYKKFLRHQRNPQLLKKSIKDKLTKQKISYPEYRKIEMGKELADNLFYIMLIAEKEGIDLTKAVKQKFNEVSKQVKSKHKIK
jgi:NTP pyrophosphatase (non-canonical NTP hydrolase)